VTAFPGRRPGAALLLSSLMGVIACAGTTAPPRYSTLQETTGRKGVTASVLRLRLYELPVQLGAIIEATADRIRADADDPAVRRRALFWEADAIPALYTAALRPDPLAGGYDLCLFVEQMRLYFQEGAGRQAFGAQQPLALSAVTKILAITEETAASLSASPEALDRGWASVREFARSHPIEGTFSSRDTALIALARLSAEERSGMFASVAEAQESISDVSLRLNAYVTLVPRMARWQAQLAAEDVLGRDSLSRTLDDLQSIGAAARRTDTVLADIPAAARAASGPFGELLDQQRAELLAAVERERLAVAGYTSSEIDKALAAIREERQAALAGIGQERAALLAGLEALSRRSIEDAANRARSLNNDVFVRALILMAAAALVFVVAYRLARGRRH
jgi:hypothetical protein